MSVRTENERVPVQRIAAAAREFVIETYERERQSPYKNPFLEFPGVPDYADFEACLGPYVERELLKVAIDHSLRNFTEREIARMLDELNAIEREIRQRDTRRAVPFRKLLPP